MRAVRAIAFALLAPGLVACQAVSSNEAWPSRVTMVLVDVSSSTKEGEIRDRYLEVFRDQILAATDGEGDDGGIVGGDVIDENPLAHGSLPIDAELRPCGIHDVKIDCEDRLQAERQQAVEAMEALLEQGSKGTDVFGGLSLSEDYFAAYRTASERSLVIFSDMEQSARGFRFGRIEDWSERAIQRLLDEVPPIPLEGVRIYVAGAGRTAADRLSPEQIDGIERFWRAYFERAGAEVVSFGPSLPRFP